MSMTAEQKRIFDEMQAIMNTPMRQLSTEQMNRLASLSQYAGMMWGELGQGGARPDFLSGLKWAEEPRPPAMALQANAKIKNRFEIKVQHIDKSNPIRNAINSLIAKINNRFGWNIRRFYKFAKTENLVAENIVLNACFTRLVNFQTYFTNIHIGTGTGTLAVTRTALFTFLAQKAANTVESVRAHPTSRWVRNIVINPEEQVGQTITEVGIAYGTASANLCTHAFLEDAEGNPISLLKTDTMVITIYATVYFQLGAIDSMYGGKWRFVQPLSSNELLSYLMGATYPTQQFRVTRAPEFSDGTAPGSLGQSSNIAVADWTKDAPNKKVTTPVRRLGVDTGNGEVRGFGLGSSDTLGTFRGQFPITGVFTSKAITGESLGAGDGSKVGFNLVWNDPQSLVVKIDDVAVDSGDYDTLPVKKGTNLFLLRQPVDVVGVTPNSGALTDGLITVPSEIPTGGSIGIDVGAARATVPIGTFRARPNGTSSRTLQLYGTNNSDFSGATLIAAVTTNANAWFESTFTAVAYRYYIVALSSGVGNFYEVEIISSSDQITFHTPPALDAVITADYSVPYVPKDTNHVLDLQCTIQYGEIT